MSRSAPAAVPGLMRQPGLAPAARSSPGHGDRVGGGLGVDRDVVGAGLGVGERPAVGVVDHQVAVQREVGGPAGSAPPAGRW